MHDSFDEIFGAKKRVLVVMAHPDDCEVTCGGLLARLTNKGVRVRLVVTTNGGKGMKSKKLDESSFARERINHQLEAADVLGIPANEVFNLNVPDGEFEASYENIGKIVFHVRQFKPDLVITHNPEEFINTSYTGSHWVNHRDHRNTASVAVDAAYPYSRDRGFFPEHFSDEKLMTHSVNELLLTDSYRHPEARFFDVSGFVEQKKEALSKHTSTFTAEDVDDYLDEVKVEEGCYEILRHVRIY